MVLQLHFNFTHNFRYGHAMCYRLETDKAGFPKETIYLAGGTTGHIYSMDIWKLERPAIARDAPWKATMLNVCCLLIFAIKSKMITGFQANGFETGRYRLEAVLHGNVLFTFGGGAPEYTAEFNEVLGNIINQKIFCFAAVDFQFDQQEIRADQNSSRPSVRHSSGKEMPQFVAARAFDLYHRRLQGHRSRSG
jgi:hypothetical protein